MGVIKCFLITNFSGKLIFIALQRALSETAMDAPKVWNPDHGIISNKRRNWNDGALEVGDQEARRQRSQMRGFIDAELVELGALSSGDDDPIKPNNLEGIHAMFAPNNWEDTIPMHMRSHLQVSPDMKPYDGSWTAHDPGVWEAIEPSLKLASKFIENAHRFPWVSFPFGA
jgi:hypothetical protein